MQGFDWRYAAGELILIVLGILAALAIDSCANQRADAAQARAYLVDLALEVRADSVGFERRTVQLDSLIASASRVLSALGGETGQVDVGTSLLGSVAGEGVSSDPVVWEELRTTGNLRLIDDSEVRSAIVAHYVSRSANMRVIDENFIPALRDVRALAWDVLPLQSFASFFRTGSAGVPADRVLSNLEGREDAEFLLKRVVLTATVARVNLRAMGGSAGEILRVLSRARGGA